MKKLVTAACALVAGLALADGGVQSANTVGYQQGTTVAGFNWYSPPFASVGETTITYGDITLSGDDVELYGDNIQILDENGGATASFVWAGDGWFDMYGSGEYMSDEIITRGTSFIVETANAGATIMCAGEVVTNTVSFTTASVAGFNWIGNPFPKAITYGDITISGENIEEYGDNIQILDENGGATASFVWAGDGWFDMYGSGEYVTDDTIAVGAGFLVETANAGATITINGFTF